MTLLRHIIILTLLAPLCSAATIYVPDHFPKIQDAIKASAPGDTVIVRPGTYLDSLDFLGKAITVKSKSGAAVTIIDGNHFGSVVAFTSGEGPNSVLEGFTLRNGYTDSGGGICCLSSSPTISNNVIRENTASFGGGGGIYCRYSSPTITGNLITANSSEKWNGGGLLCELDSDPIVKDNTISHNQSYNKGGGIYCFISSPRITGNVILENAAFTGGGICCDYSSSPTVAENDIAGNSADSRGGGIYCAKESAPAITNNLIKVNSVSGSGGGIYCTDSSDPARAISLVGNTIMENSATRDGGGIYCSKTSGASIANNRITRNVAHMDGGGLTIRKSLLVTVFRNVISQNEALRDGGGILSYASSPVLAGNMIVCNRSLEDGGGISLSYDNAVSTNNTVAKNSVDGFGGGLFLFESSPVITNSILWNNVGAANLEIYNYNGAGNPSVTFCDVRGGWPGAGNIDADPLFADPGVHDFHLTWGSPCRNSGDNLAVNDTVDFEGDRRVALGTVDMGADEVYFHLYQIGTVIPGIPIGVNVVGRPGDPARIAMSRGLQNPPQPTPYGDLWLTMPPAKTWNQGTIPGTGILTVVATVPSGWASGSEHHFQALVGPWGGTQTSLTNLMTLVTK